MKIEIEYEAVERLKNQVEIQKREIDHLKNKLASCSEKELKENAINFSFKLLDDYLSAVFKELGFEQPKTRHSVIVKNNIVEKLGEDWYLRGEVEFELGATVTNLFRTAFLHIGVKPPKSN